MLMDFQWSYLVTRLVRRISSALLLAHRVLLVALYFSRFACQPQDKGSDYVDHEPGVVEHGVGDVVSVAVVVAFCSRPIQEI